MARRTVADLRALKGKGQLTMLRLTTLDEAQAAQAAGIDIGSVTPDLLLHPDFRTAAPDVFAMTGQTHTEGGTADDQLRFACKMIEAGADAIYCSGSMRTVEHMAREFIPVVGHIGLVPARATWTGGFRAVGKTADSALAMHREVQAYADAGAFAAEIEVVPAAVATAISQRTELLLWSMGSGAGCDAQYLFSEDLLGENRGHMPRHSKVYRNFAAEYDRLQSERIAAFSEFREDVAAGRFPSDDYLVPMPEDELAAFLKALDA